MFEKCLDEKNIEVISIPFSDSSDESDQSSILETARIKPKWCIKLNTCKQPKNNKPKSVNKPEVVKKKQQWKATK